MKLLQVPENLKELMVQDFLEKLNSAQLNAKTNFSYSYKLDSIPDEIKKIRPTVLFTASAYQKLRTLVLLCNDEIGWHGTVERKGPYSFLITDILVYPQYVTGATVTANEEEYAEWKMNLTDEQYNSIRYFGHSHVNMGTSPSGVDDGVQRDYINTLTKNDDFYIFSINNKRDNIDVMLYDMQHKVLFETKDIYIDVVDEKGELITMWGNEAIETYVTKMTPVQRTFSTVTTTTTTTKNTKEDKEPKEPKRRQVSKYDAKIQAYYDEMEEYYSRGFS